MRSTRSFRHVFLPLVVLISCGATSVGSAQRPAPTSAPTVEVTWTKAETEALELARFDDPLPYLPKSGPGGTEWDAQYRSFIQTDDNAATRGFPTHGQAAGQIRKDAAKSPENLKKHLAWVLFIKHFSNAYRPPDATKALKSLYGDLVKMEFAKPKTSS